MYSWDIVSRFWRKTFNVPGGCIFWTRQCNKDGYGVMWHKGKHLYAHRFSLEVKLGRPIAEGKWSLHKCPNKCCVNPDHLYEGTPSQNSLDVWLDGKRCKIDKTKRKSLIKEIESGANIPLVCAKYGVRRNWYADHKRLVRLGRRDE